MIKAPRFIDGINLTKIQNQIPPIPLRKGESKIQNCMTKDKKTVLDLLAGEDDRLALAAPNKPSLTYKQLRQNAIAGAAKLNRLGIGRGERVAIAIPNSPEMVVTFLATTICTTAAPLNFKYKQEEFSFYYQDTNAAALIVLGDGIEAAIAATTPEMTVIRATLTDDGMLSFEKISGAERPSRAEAIAQADDVAMILHTSGTTSRPKRVPIRHRNLVASLRSRSHPLFDAVVSHSRFSWMSAKHICIGRDARVSRWF
jgi:acyl-CoA synthetase (AMP-forming)/AMP-acid ligase II